MKEFVKQIIKISRVIKVNNFRKKYKNYASAVKVIEVEITKDKNSKTNKQTTKMVKIWEAIKKAEQIETNQEIMLLLKG